MSEKKSKESQMSKNQTKFSADDVVLAKIRGFPSWPGIVVDDQHVPSAVLKERPVVKNRELYTIRFFPSADYHWAFAKDLETLTESKIDQWLSNQARKKGDLRKAYELARDPVAWNKEQNQIVINYEQSLEEEDDEEAENEDQLQEEPEAAEEGDRVANKKRKRSTETGKVRESATKPKKSKVAEAAKSKPTDKGDVSMDVNGDGQAGDEAMDPETKKVKEWRMKLQKAFLPKSEQINAADMPQLDAVFRAAEEYDAITADQLRATKIGKVTKKIMQLADVPRDDEFHFKTRAEQLCIKWGAVMAGNGSSHENGTPSASEKIKTDTNAAAPKTETTEQPPAAVDEEPKPQATTETSAAPVSSEQAIV